MGCASMPKVRVTLVFAVVASSSAFAHRLAVVTGRRDHHRTKVVAAEDAAGEEKAAKALKAMTGFANSYCKNTGTTYCSDLSIPAVVLKGLAEHKVTLGAPLCPCRHYEDKAAEAKDGFWNCPCVPMRERHDCHCMLFLTADNEFAGDQNKIDVEHVKSVTDGMTILCVRAM